MLFYFFRKSFGGRTLWKKIKYEIMNTLFVKSMKKYINYYEK